MNSPPKGPSPILVGSSSSPPRGRSRSRSLSPTAPSRSPLITSSPSSPTRAATHADGQGLSLEPTPKEALPADTVIVSAIKRSTIRKSNLRKKPALSSASRLPNNATPLSPDKPDDTSNTIDLIADIKYARKLRARGGRGVDAHTLVSAIAGDGEDAGDKANKEKDGMGDISKLEAITVGGLSKVGSKEKEGYLSAFTGTNKTLDATKHMERYIEDQLAKRRQALTSTSSSPTDDSSATKASLSYDDELYTIPDHLRVEKPQLVEGSVTASAAMLTAIPEIDLGPDSKTRAIVQTERILARGLGDDAGTGDVEHDLAFHNNPFPSMRWRISRKTRESLYDMTHGNFHPPSGALGMGGSSSARSVEQAVTEELTRDRRGQRVVGAQGIVTNDEELKRRFELERRLGEVQGGRDVRTVVVDHNQQQQQQQQQQRGREREVESEVGQPEMKKRRMNEGDGASK